MHHDTVSDTAYTPTQPPAPPRDASTVVVLRDGAGRARGPEVYLVKRSRMVDFMAGAHVFPGGRLDRDDSSPSALALLSAEVAALHARLGEALPAVQAAGLYVAAIRETFEEAGLLLGRLAAGWSSADARHAVAGGAQFTTLVDRIDAAALVPWVRWVTPLISPRRFDARFFLARAPEGQDPQVDGREATEGLWITPAEALERWREDELLLAPATAKSLDALAAFGSVDEALASASARPPPVMMPHVWNDTDGRAYISLPGDPRHPVVQDALGGRILRLKLEAGRYQAVTAA
jgi:8-oxo-dGTP pyrophosphatase MutT (NUDIX family)